jgi:hypothetical protein
MKKSTLPKAVFAAVFALFGNTRRGLFVDAYYLVL